MPSWTWSWSSAPPPPPMLSPCIGVCELDLQGVCRGCHRSSEEITRWTQYTDAQRQQLMDVELPRRAADRER